jgi:hypothetical protein
MPVIRIEELDNLEHHEPTEAPEGEIVGLPTMLAKFDGYYPADQVLQALGSIEYPLEDVSVLFRLQGTDQVLDLTTGDVAAGQSVTEEEIRSEKVKGQTVVLAHPPSDRLESVRQALSQVGNVEIEYSGETHALAEPGGVDRQDERIT